MIHHKVEQGSAEWLKARLGIPTASAFHRIVTPKGAPSRKSDSYLCELMAEQILCRQVTEFDTTWTIRGSDLEANACAYYEMNRGVDLQVCGLFTTDDGKVGASPDFLVGDDGLVEVKAKKPVHHMAYVLGFADVVKDHRIQVQGQLWVTERQWCDVVAYSDNKLPKAIQRVPRDEEFIAALEKHVRAFGLRVDELSKLIGSRVAA